MAKFDYLYEKHKIKKYKINWQGIELFQFVSDDYKTDDVLFIKNKNNGSYDPFIYDYFYDEKLDEHFGIKIEEGDIIYEFVRCVKNTLKRTDVKNNTVEEGSFFIHQWANAINILLESMKYNSKFHDLEQSRQTKLSGLGKLF